MVNLGLRRVEDSVAAKHPVRMGAGGAGRPASVGTGSGAAFAVQKLVNRRLPYALQWNLLLSVAAGSLASYTVTRAETQKCSDFWIYLETGTSPQEHSTHSNRAASSPAWELSGTAEWDHGGTERRDQASRVQDVSVA
uniref:Transmembrane protein 141 n=1 Tax=Coturnix japonica TaxID=93934 RepID=A0A8C2TVW1_COTJA